MLNRNDLFLQLPHVLRETDFDFLPNRYVGKVRDSYVKGDKRVLVTSDRLSCFDVVVTTVPYKGQVLNSLALYWFGKTKDIIPNHILDVPDPNVMVVKNVEMLPVEVIVRGYITGSAWRDYCEGKAISGIRLPAGLKASEKLPENIITPSTKAEHGDHDMPISEAEIVSSGLVDAKLWSEVHEKALALFDLGQKEAAKRGLILVDTKYEFGLVDGKLILADEIHTLDSSRYWVAESYDDCFKKGFPPKMLDKEPVRQWLLAQGFKGDGDIPTFTDEYRVELSEHYITSYQQITGEELKLEVGDVKGRVEKALRATFA